ncbi:MAG: hypothetical protein U0610_29460 [bacterium]
MIVECAWCGALLGQKEPLLDTRPTSGICDECVEQLESGQVCAAPRLRSPSPRIRALRRAGPFELGSPALMGIHELPTVRVRRSHRH